MWECASNRIDQLDWAQVIYWFASEICIQPYRINAVLYNDTLRCKQQTQSIYSKSAFSVSLDAINVKYPAESQQTETHTEYDRSIYRQSSNRFDYKYTIFVNMWVCVCLLQRFTFIKIFLCLSLSLFIVYCSLLSLIAGNFQ